MKRCYLKYFYKPHVAVKILLERWIGIPFPNWFVNFIFQRILRLNSDVPFQVNFSSTVIRGKGIYIGKNVWKSFAMSTGCYIQGVNGIHIGDDTIFASGVKIISANHNSINSHKWINAPPIKIGSKCWIGANVVILPGIELSDNCIVGAGSVVSKSLPPKTVSVGNPAKIIRTIF